MNYKERYNHWLENPSIDEADKKALLDMKDNDDKTKEHFYCDLEFGTGGLRGVIGVGTNRINKYMIRKTTQGFAQYIKNAGNGACEHGIVIAHDNRRFSIEFSLETAGVLAANGIKAYIFDSLRPTPELSFAVRELGCFGGVMITASHNPPEYNGYKLYDERGCQLVPEVNDLVVAEIDKVTDPLAVTSLSKEEAGGLIVTLDGSIDEKYYNRVMDIVINPDLDKSNLKIVYSPQHGTGNVPVREVLKRHGYNVTPVEEQCVPDTEFSKTLNPNPETAEAYVMALEYAEKNEAKQFIVATESGILHEMMKRCPEKEFIPVPPMTGSCACNECAYMRLNTLEKLYNTLKYEWPAVELDESLIEDARRPITRMLELSKQLTLKGSFDVTPNQSYITI